MNSMNKWTKIVGESELQGVQRLREELRGQGIASRIVGEEPDRALVVPAGDAQRARQIAQSFVCDATLDALDLI